MINKIDELERITSINRQIIYFIICNITILVLIIIFFIIQSKKTITTYYQEHTNSFVNPITQINYADKNLSASKLYEENNIINFLKKTFTLLGGLNPYIKEIGLYTTPTVNEYYKNQIATTRFFENYDEKKLLKNFYRNIKIFSITKLANNIITNDGSIQKAYQLEIEIKEYSHNNKKNYITEATVNMIISYHNKKKIKNLTKINNNYSIINPLNLKIITLFIAIK